MNKKTQYSSTLEQSTKYTFLFILSVTVFFVGATEFMLSSMLNPLAVAFGTTAVGASWLVSSYAFSYALQHEQALTKVWFWPLQKHSIIWGSYA
ncbi:hypothetical protein [Photorhabdus sp. SF281]|uniref:hypothetical protein n=1 Tax=Photorhabdus sp. SF281 TaxID=3459527 RepID=UPI0040440DCE